MADRSEHIVTSCPGEGLSGFQRYWPLDENASGYGVAAYIGTGRITCRLFNLETNELLDTQRIMGDFESLKNDELSAIINDLFILLSQNAGLKLSKLTTAVVSGTTAMECIAAGVDPTQYHCDKDEEVELLGCDIEYLMAGPNSIAVGEAYYVPCISTKIGGDFLCSLLAIDILTVESPLLFVNTGPDAQTNTVIAYGDSSQLNVSVLPLGANVDQGIRALLGACGVPINDVEHVLITGCVSATIPEELADRVRIVNDAAIEGASAILLSELAEDELCRIVDACRVVKL